jgi:hypothetical protein
MDEMIICACEKNERGRDHTIVYDDTKEFRLKLVAILLSLELNKRKGSPLLDSDENIGSPSECAIIQNPKMAEQETF